MPSDLTPFTMSSTASNCGPSFTSRHAAPMQKRVAPASRACFAEASTSSTCISFSALTPVSYLAACGQYAQSSEQPPVLIDNRLHSCTLLSFHTARCIDWARKIRSSRGSS
jgi:hypothetical protein